MKLEEQTHSQAQQSLQCIFEVQGQSHIYHLSFQSLNGEVQRYYEQHWVIRLLSKMSWCYLDVLKTYLHSWIESTLLPIKNSMIGPDLHLEFHLVAK